MSEPAGEQRGNTPPQTVPPEVLPQFGLPTDVRAEVIAGGHINRTWRIDHANGSAVLQWINGIVFPNPAQLVANTFAVAQHVRARDALVPEQFRTRDGQPFARDEAGAVWRLTSFVPSARTLQAPTRRSEAVAAGAGFGRFLHLTADFPTMGFVPAIAGFHDLRPRLAAYDAALAHDATQPQALRRAAQMPDVCAVIDTHRDALLAFSFAALPARLIHGDCKTSNLLLAADRDVPVAVLDLDTVMVATLLFDFADLVRAACAIAPEDEPDTARVGVHEGWFAAIAYGFQRELAQPLTPEERALAVPACAYIAFMLGVRFASDFLGGDRYFATQRPNQNRDRARAQLRIAELLLGSRTRLDALLDAPS